MTKLHPISFAFMSLALIFLAVVHADRDTLSVLEWNEWFDRLFANKPHELNAPNVLLILMRLHRGSHRMINQVRKDIAEFWFEANIGAAEHCSVDYLARLDAERDKYLSHNYKRNVIYEFTRRRVIGNCYARLLNGVIQIESLRKEDRENIFKLGLLWSQVQSDAARESDRWILGNFMSYLVAPEACREKSYFIVSWRNGICSHILSRLTGEELRILKFLAMFDYDTRQKTSETGNKWVTGLEACKHLLSQKALDEVWSYVQVSVPEKGSRPYT